MANKSAKFEALKPFFFFFFLACETYTMKVDVLQDQKMYGLQVRPCIFRPGNFTGWRSEGVKEKLTLGSPHRVSAWISAFVVTSPRRRGEEEDLAPAGATDTAAVKAPKFK